MELVKAADGVYLYGRTYTTRHTVREKERMEAKYDEYYAFEDVRFVPVEGDPEVHAVWWRGRPLAGERVWQEKRKWRTGRGHSCDTREEAMAAIAEYLCEGFATLQIVDPRPLPLAAPDG